MSLFNVQQNLLRNLLRVNQRVLGARNVSKSKALTEEEEKEFLEASEVPATFVDDEDDKQAREAEIELRRNKSRLLPQHRRIVMGQKPYDEAKIPAHETVKYQRMLFGKYGLSSGVDPKICFPTQKEKFDEREIEKMKYSLTLHEMMEIEKQSIAEKVKIFEDREEQISKKMMKLAQWEKELKDKIAQKEAKAKAEKDRKERNIEKVRRHFGFKLDARDDRFKELLQQMEKEDKKKMKEEKRQAKEAKMIAKLQDMDSKNPVQTPIVTAEEKP